MIVGMKISTLKVMISKWAAFTFLVIIGVSKSEDTAAISETNFTFDPCCSFPCKHGGICVQTTLHNYECDCENLGYHGKNCEKGYFSTKLKEMMSFPYEYKELFLCGEPLLWGLVNHVQYFYEPTLRMFYTGNFPPMNSPARFNLKYDYITFEPHFENSLITRILPQVPNNCPTPMGVLGPKVLPDEQELFDKLFKRRKFKADPHDTSLLFLIFTEHLSHMLFKEDEPVGYDFSRLPNEFDSDHVYGKDEATRKELRVMAGGKLKTSSVNGEVYPPLLVSSVDSAPPALPDEDMCNEELKVIEGETGIDNAVVKGCVADVPMNYPEDATGLRFALAHPNFGKSPFLIMISTILIREHNRIANITAKEHPDWDDERIYQVSRLIVTGELIQITISDYLKQLTQFKLDITWDPLIFEDKLTADILSLEMHQLKHWHAMFPDCIKVRNKTYNFSETFYNNQLLTKHGIDFFADILSRQIAGKVTYRNYAEIFRKVVVETIIDARKNRLQSFNNYRKRYGLKPYKNMVDMCGDARVAQTLEHFYGDVNAVELFVGLAVEKQQCSVFPSTQLVIGTPYIMKSIIASPLNSRDWWKPSTFGGPIGFKIVNDVTLRGLFCINMKNLCSGEEYISFQVPSMKDLSEEAARKRRRLWCLDDDEIMFEV